VWKKREVMIMDKKSLINSMERYVGGSAFINKSQLAKYLRRSRDAMPNLLSGLDYLETKREKKYFIPDVAQKLMDLRACGRTI